MTFNHLAEAVVGDTIQSLEAHRTSYAYPAAFLEASGPLDLSQCAHPFSCRVDGVTGSELEGYLSTLLRSDDVGQRLVGVAAVVYWGFFTFSHGYAEVRVQRVWDVLRAEPDRLKGVRDAAEQANMGRALGALKALPQLGGVPFASKVIAFLHPQRAGVYDNKINRLMCNLQRLPPHLVAWLEPHAAAFAITHLRPVSSPAVQQRYTQWCEFLRNTATALNDRGSRWSGNAWRALDVERAIFAMAEANP